MPVPEVLEISEERTELVGLPDEEVEVDDVRYVLYAHEGDAPEWALGLTYTALGKILGYARDRDAGRLVRRHRDELSNYLITKSELASFGAGARQTVRPRKNKDLRQTCAEAGQEANEDSEVILFGPGIDCVIMHARGARAKAFRAWLSKRSYELRTRGTTTAAGSPRMPSVADAQLPAPIPDISSMTTATPADMIRQHAAAMMAIASSLEGHEERLGDHGSKLDDHEERIRGNEERLGALGALVVKDKSRRNGIRVCDRAVLASDFQLHGCTVCGRRSLGFQVGHVVSCANGGKSDISNLMPQCKGCNLNETVEDRRLRSSKDESYVPDPRPDLMRARYANLAEGLMPGQGRMWA